MFVIYVLSVLACVLILVNGFDRLGTYDVKWREDKHTEPTVLIAFAGFGVFPVINTLMVIAFLFWLLREGE